MQGHQCASVIEHGHSAGETGVNTDVHTGASIMASATPVANIPGGRAIDVETMLEWAKRMTWKGVHPMVELSRTVYAKGVSLSKSAMRAVEARLERNPLLPKWNILIHRPEPIESGYSF